jgi:hypothetical protein
MIKGLLISIALICTSAYICSELETRKILIEPANFWGIGGFTGMAVGVIMIICIVRDIKRPDN